MYRNGKPGPGQYNVDQKRKVKFYMGKSERLKTEGDQEYNVGPQTYNLK